MYSKYSIIFRGLIQTRTENWVEQSSSGWWRVGSDHYFWKVIIIHRSLSIFLKSDHHSSKTYQYFSKVFIFHQNLSIFLKSVFFRRNLSILVKSLFIELYFSFQLVLIKLWFYFDRSWSKFKSADEESEVIYISQKIFVYFSPVLIKLYLRISWANR